MPQIPGPMLGKLRWWCIDKRTNVVCMRGEGAAPRNTSPDLEVIQTRDEQTAPPKPSTE